METSIKAQEKMAVGHENAINSENGTPYLENREITQQLLGMTRYLERKNSEKTGLNLIEWS